MTRWLPALTDELVKMASEQPLAIRSVLNEAQRDIAREARDDRSISSLRGHGAPVSRDYLASMMIGALAAPLLTIAGKGISRAMHNRSVVKAMENTHFPSSRRLLKAEFQTGRLIGGPRPDLPISARPLMTPGDILSDAAKGALGGSIVQMLRDRFSGSSRVKRQ